MIKKLWNTIRHEKLFAVIYIFGTALALASTTVAVVVLNSMIAPVYPEYERPRTAYLSQMKMYVTSGGDYQYGLSYELVRDHIYKLENADKVSAYLYKFHDSYVVGTDGLEFSVKLKPCDPAFFDIYSFRFLAGKPFTDEDMASGMPVAVIGEATARKALGAGSPDEYIGRTVMVDLNEYRIVGVVREATPTQNDSYAGVYIPYTSVDGFDDSVNGVPWIGSLHAVMTTDNIDALKAEIASLAARFNSSRSDYRADFYDMPLSHLDHTFRRGPWQTDFNVWSIFYVFGIIIMALLLIPALNLSGIISGHMENRMSEMGLRKSFGATRGRLLRDVLRENLALTICGGLVGFVFSYILLKSGIANLFMEDAGSSANITDEMIFSPVIFLSILVICAILNVLSGLIPVYRSLRRPVVQSLNG